MYHSVVKVKKKYLGPEFFKIKLQILIYNIVCLASTSYVHAVLLCCLLVITSVNTSKKVVLNKNTMGIKIVRGQSEAALQIDMCDQKL